MDFLLSKNGKQRHEFVLDKGEEYSEEEGNQCKRRLFEVFL